MSTAANTQASSLPKDALQAFDNLDGLHPGYRPVHAKGILLAGVFTPSHTAKSLTRAPHIERPSTPVSVRFSDFTGIPTIADTDPNASPRGMATRFHLAEHVHTDLIAHSVNGFPVRTAEEFVDFLRAAHASAPGTPSPTPIEQFLASHPAALKFVQAPKPVPVSFATESYFAVNAYRFTNAAEVTRFGRYRVYPASSGEYLDNAAAAAKGPNFLFDELRSRLQTGPVEMRVSVQVALLGDITDDSTLSWPDDRPEIDFGTISITHEIPNAEAEQRHIIFDPIPRVDGIEPSGDPLLQPRADTYLVSGRRRRAEGK